MIHRRLFDLAVRHDFFPGGACPDLALSPSNRLAGGARALARHRLRARLRPGGLEILAPLGDDARPFIDLTDLRLSLDLEVTGDDFVHYTDLADWKALGAPHYRGSAAEGGALALTAAPAPHPPGLAATIEIAVDPAWLAAPPRFTLDLKARRALWVYYLLTARPNGQPPEIRDDEPGRGLAFERVLLAPGGLSPADDPVGSSLLARHPERRCFRFSSAAPLACSRAPARRLALYLGPEQLVRELPSPDIRAFATLRVAPEGDARDSLSCVLEY